MANEPHIVEFCPNDPITRFSGLRQVKAWNAKKRGFVGIYDVVGSEGKPLSENQLIEITDEDILQLAYGWSGPELNRHIKGADITTAYRVGRFGLALARERRKSEVDHFSLGYPLGELVIASSVVLFGAEPSEISLETWESNQRAVALYELMGFKMKARAADERPTLQPAGTEINGNVVSLKKEGKHIGRNMVTDTRRYYVLEDHPLVAVAA